MRVRKTELPGVLLVEPEVYRDERGLFFEAYHQERYRAAGVAGPFVQDNHSHSVAGTLRGLHAQCRYPQGKLIRVLAGEILDVAVDIRRGSPTFGKWTSARLSATNLLQCYVPLGFVHGFCVLSSEADVEYKCTSSYVPDDQLVVRWNDPRIGIRWPVAKPHLSERDRRARSLEEQWERLPEF